MIKTVNYFIYINKSKCLVESNSHIVEFTFEENPNKDTLRSEAQISDFQCFEEGLRKALDQLHYKSGIFIKNILYFSVPNDIDEVQVVCYFDAADRMECRDSNLLKEDLAILLNDEFRQYKEQNVLMISVFASKVDFSLINKLSFKFQRTIHFDSGLIIKDFGLFKSILGSIKSKFDVSKIYLSNMRYDDLYKDIIDGSEDFSIVDNREELILKGLNKVSALNGYLVTNRFKLY